ncbi:AraC family transcriptional regulator [Paenibacillus thalictri]|uniref:AraC family transcriptional regulator n=1 Tax=Paenibacillus thalictri TaxID=2527873 RepID=A0A4Q9DZ42_9BACL|nr:AraC family transcriptional regulator [Paenibacillus thalictri]TBL81696.1 AraC family transcriptional regulator [Paenibacillus thalictri]
MKSNWNDIVVHIFWVLNKLTFKGWEDIRQNKSRHSFYWIHEGEGVFRTGETFHVRKGNLVYLAPGLELSMKSSDNDPLVMTMIYFDCADYRYGDAGWGLQPLDSLELPLLQQMDRDRAIRMDLLFEALHRDWIPSRSGGELLSKGHLLAILECAHQAAPFEDEQDSTFRSYLKVKQELEEQFHQRLHIEDLARKHSVSCSYLRKMFIRHLHMSPKAYLDQIRNDHAIRYLSYSDIPVKKIAEACGFNDEFQFSKAFKKMNGSAPSAYRAARQQPKTLQPEP